MLCSCEDCRKRYVGETDRPMRVRVSEHYQQAKDRCRETPWGEYYLLEHPDVNTQTPDFLPFTDAEILSRHSDTVNRKIAESLHIRKFKPQVNRDRGWRLIGQNR